MKGFSSRATSKDPVVDHLNNAFDMVVRSPPRKRSLRCSSLPFCPILDAITPRDSEDGDLSGALYMGMGTIIHSSLQFFMSLGIPGANMWGCWKCSVCGKEATHTFRPDDCCNLPMGYVEVSLRVACLTGHVDFIARYGKKWVLLDFKTIGKDPGAPKRQHLLQVRHYVAMLKLQHNIDIHAVYIVYIGRSFLDRWVYGPYDAQKPRQRTIDWIFRAIAGYKAATKVRKDSSRVNLIELIKTRPCKSMDDWEAYMSRGYQFTSTKNKCPLLASCCAGNKACLNAVEEMVNG